MSYLILDTETNTFPNDKLPATHPAQAHICQLALLQLDELFKELSCVRFLIKPEGRWQVHDGAFQVHHISTKMCDSIGIARKDALDIYMEHAGRCKFLVGHNLSFDNKMINIELTCANIKNLNGYHYKEICTMLSMTPIMKLEKKKKNSFGSEYKWPKLREAYEFVMRGKELENSHDALVDVKATAKVLQWLVENKFVNTSS